MVDRLLDRCYTESMKKLAKRIQMFKASRKWHRKGIPAIREYIESACLFCKGQTCNKCNGTGHDWIYLDKAPAIDEKAPF